MKRRFEQMANCITTAMLSGSVLTAACSDNTDSRSVGEQQRSIDAGTRGTGSLGTGAMAGASSASGAGSAAPLQSQELTPDGGAVARRPDQGVAGGSTHSATTPGSSPTPALPHAGPAPAVAQVTVFASGNNEQAGLAHDADGETSWSPAMDRDTITISLGTVRAVSEIAITSNTAFTISGDSAAFADSPLEITLDGESWIAVPLINFNNLENSCEIFSFSDGSLACGFVPPRSLSQVRFEIRQEQLIGVPSVQDIRIHEIDVAVVGAP